MIKVPWGGITRKGFWNQQQVTILSGKDPSLLDSLKNIGRLSNLFATQRQHTSAPEGQGQDGI